VPPTALPATVTITVPAQAAVAGATSFSSNTDSSGRLSYQWSFGDGSSSTVAAPSHAYERSGEYAVTLTVINEAGASKTASTTLVVRDLANVAGAVCSGAGEAGWCWQNPRPSGNAVADVVFADAVTGWAVGDAGLILKTSDGGATWVGQFSGVTANLTQVRFFDAAVGWALGGEGTTVLKTSDGGSTWVRQAASAPATYYYGSRLRLLSRTSVLITSDYGNRSSSDGGETWRAWNVVASVVTPGGVAWALTYNGVAKTSDLGQTWTQTFTRPDNLNSQGPIVFSDDQHGWIVGTEYGVMYDYSTLRSVAWRSVDGGSTWTKTLMAGLPTGYSYSINSVFFDAAGVGWISTYSGLFRSLDAGATWSAVGLPSGVSYAYYVQAIDGNTLWFAYNNGVYLTVDGGASWRFLAVADENYYGGNARLQIVDASHYWLHYSGRSYRSSDAGATFTRSLGADAQTYASNVQATWFFDGKHGLALGSGGWIDETVDGGSSWTRKALSSAVSSYDTARFQFTSRSNGWLKVGSSAIYKTTDGGASWWAPLGGTQMSGLSDFHFVDVDHGWAVSSSGIVYGTADGGSNWTQLASLSSNYYYGIAGVRFIDANIGVVAGGGGAVYRTTDGGKTWTLRPTGVMQDLRRVVFTSKTTGWAVGIYGVVIKTVDAGLTWTKVATPATQSLNDAFFLDADHGWIVGEGGTVVATDDGGLSWSLQGSGTSTTLYSAYFTSTQTGWIVGAGGAILATATGGR